MEENIMRKFLVWLCIGALTFGMVSCGSRDAGNDDTGSQTEEPVTTPDTPAPETESTPASQDVPADGNVSAGHDYADGWSDEMEAVKAAVVDLLGENYFPNMPLEPEMLEQLVGLTPDMYEDYLAEVPMISTNVDTLIVVKAAEGQADTLEETLNAYHDAKVGDTMQYPQNIGKIQASKVARIGDDYVIFVLLGGDVADLLDQGDEVVITHCQKVNDSVIETISEALR